MQEVGERELNDVLFDAFDPARFEFAQEFTLDISGLALLLLNAFPHAIGSLIWFEIPWIELQGYLKPDLYSHFTDREWPG